MAKLIFSEKEKMEYSSEQWEMLIVDDEEEIHSITESVLKKFVFEEKYLKFYHAYNAKEAIQIVKENPKIALVFLDVVMETTDAGLKVVKSIREDLNNKIIRIILRTGQPGSAPEKKIILTYDINDYKEKTELTSTKLFTSVITALRSYKELTTIRNNKFGLEQIIESNRIINMHQDFQSLVKNILSQLVNVLYSDKKQSADNQLVYFIKPLNDSFEIYHSVSDEALKEEEHFKHIEELLHKAQETEKNVFDKDDYIAYFKINEKVIYYIYFNNYLKLCDLKKYLIEIFLSNVLVSIKNVCLHNEMINHLDNQKKDLEIKVKETVIEITKKDKLIQQQSRLAQLGEMISMIAHQWRQPLNAIAANSIGVETKMAFWKENDNLSTQKGRNEIFDFITSKLENIERYVQSLSLTIDNFRDFYKPSKDKKIISVNHSILQALDIVEATMVSKSITINKKYNSKKESSLFHHELMQVFLNILKNTQDNFDEKNTKNPIVTIVTTDIPMGVRIDIYDNGGGIEEDIKDKIFDPYFSTKEDKNGTGLGMYMSKLIIEEHHGGKIYFNNTGNGVRFSIELYD